MKIRPVISLTFMLMLPLPAQTDEAALIDDANVLAADVRRKLDEEIKIFSQDQGLHLVVVTRRKDDSFRKEGVRLEACKEESRRRIAGRGILMLIVPEEDVVICGKPYLPACIANTIGSVILDKTVHLPARGGDVQAAIEGSIMLILKTIKDDGIFRADSSPAKNTILAGDFLPPRRRTARTTPLGRKNLLRIKSPPKENSRGGEGTNES